jgi:hypothetical protein
MTIRDMWRRITARRYTRTLEAEVARLRAENRALLNSVLGIAGIPPIPAASPDPACAAGAASSAPTNDISGGRDSQSAGRAAGTRLPLATRRRSWQQINRMLEFESARKAATSSE